MKNWKKNPEIVYTKKFEEKKIDIQISLILKWMGGFQRCNIEVKVRINVNEKESF